MVSGVTRIEEPALRFSELTPAQRVDALLDAGSFEPGGPSGSLVLGRGRIDGLASVRRRDRPGDCAGRHRRGGVARHVQLAGSCAR